ncbi:MAG: polyamine aminopropyltransferase [Candidatus Muiribacteriota bacterium]
MLDGGKIRFNEKHSGDYGIFIDADEILYSKKSKYQLVEVISSKTWGRILLLDRNIMTTEKDEFVYHEMITQVPYFCMPEARSALVIGGGDGGTVRELLRHKQMEKVTLVEIDNDVIKVCKKFFPEIASSFDDPRLEIITGDGIKFVENVQRKFDIIIIDSSDPFGPAEGLFREEFYQNCKNILNKKGVLTCQAGNAFVTQEAVIAYKNLKKVFKNVEYYLANILTYGGLWGFAFASDTQSSKDFDLKKYKETDLNYMYYSEKIHKASFVLPPFFKQKLESKGLLNEIY